MCFFLSVQYSKDETHLSNTVNIKLTRWNLHSSTGKHPLTARLGGVQVSYLRLWGQDGDVQVIRHGQIILVGDPRHYVSITALDQVLDTLQSPGAVLQESRQTHSVGLKKEIKVILSKSWKLKEYATIINLVLKSKGCLTKYQY